MYVYCIVQCIQVCPSHVFVHYNYSHLYTQSWDIAYKTGNILYIVCVQLYTIIKSTMVYLAFDTYTQRYEKDQVVYIQLHLGKDLRWINALFHFTNHLSH